MIAIFVMYSTAIDHESNGSFFRGEIYHTTVAKMQVAAIASLQMQPGVSVEIIT